jgi:predicted DNA-binding ribbon-helix-helix protein
MLVILSVNLYAHNMFVFYGVLGYDFHITKNARHALVEKFKVRSAAVTGGPERTSFRFDTQTWAAIDMISERKGMGWVEWVAQVVASRPHAKSKAAAVRATVEDELLADQFKAVAEERAAGPKQLPDSHPIIGKGYYRLDDETLGIELDGAEITTEDDCFEGFTLIAGYRNRDLGGHPFVCVKNRLRGGLHLFIAQGV